MKYLLLTLLTLISGAQAEELIEDAEIECLALNIYHEARGSSFVDQASVADVTLNRVESTKYPNTVCGVVYQAQLSQWHLDRGRKVPVRDKCQFSWYCDGKSDKPKDVDAYTKSIYLAYNMLTHGDYRGITEGSTHYHAHYVNPSWARKFVFVSRIGDHFYYKVSR